MMQSQLIELRPLTSQFHDIRSFRRSLVGRISNRDFDHGHPDRDSGRSGVSGAIATGEHAAIPRYPNRDSPVVRSRLPPLQSTEIPSTS